MELKIITSDRNYGKGHAVRSGMLHAKGKVRIFSDADGSTPAGELGKLLPPLRQGQFDIVIGSRYLPGADIEQKQPFLRRFWSRLSNLFVQQLLLPGIVDPHCGFKGFSADAAEKLFSHSTVNEWSFDLEILALANKFKFRLLEVPVKWANDGRSKGRVRHLPKEILNVMRIKRSMRRIK